MRKHRSLVLVLMMIVLCATIIVGSTMAYYTDEVPASENLVTSGDLEVKFEWADKLGEEWQDAASAGPIFNQTHWEPNFTTVKYIQVSNTGDMPFQYELNVVPTLVPEEGVNLMDVIDVYFGVVDENTPAITAANYADELQKVGNLTALLKNENGAGYGIVLPKDAKGTLPQGAVAYNESVTVCIALHMQHTAGNEYMNRSVGEGFNVQLAATQYTYDDAFGTLFSGGAQLPEVEYATSKTVSVTPDENGLVPYDIVFESDTGVIAVVPKGARMEQGATQLILIVYPKAKSDANLSLQANEVVNAWEVKVEGLADDNTVPVRFTLPEAMQKGLNIGNYSLYHVENGTSVPMTRVEEITASSAHNSFSYNPATGDMGLVLATFSEVAIVSEPAKWEGNYDYSWYTNAVMPVAEGDADYIIANADQLAAFGAIVGGMNGQTQDSFKDKTVKLISDINLGDKESENNADIIFYPIGYYNSNGNYDKVSGGSVTSSVSSFEGTFDGNGHTVKNFYQNTWEMFGDYNNGYSGTPNHYKDAMGLFGYVVNGKVCNLTVDNFSSDGEFAPTGVIAAYAVNSTFENIAITNCNPRVYNTGNGGIVGIGGNSDDPDTYKLTFTNITIDNTNTISALWGSWDVACGGLVGMFQGDGHVYMTNCHVAAQIDVYNDVCGNYQYYWYRYSGMMIGSIRKNMTENGYTVPDPTGITFTDCSATYGPWADYVYCEFTDNSQASYTEDYQFSRVEAKDLKVVGNQIECTHTHKDVEDKRAVLLPFNQLFNGYGYGVKAVTDYDGVKIIHKDNENAIRLSDYKFKYIGKTELEADREYKINELFGYIPGKLNVSSTGVVVSITDLDNTDGIVSAEYTVNNEMGWEENTIKFSGTGEVELIIQDYYFCTPTVVKVEIGNRQAIDKFTAKDELNFVHTTEGGTISKTLGDIFEPVEGAIIDSANVVVTIEPENEDLCKYTKNDSDWTKSELSFTGTGSVMIKITDNDYCNEAKAAVKITEPDPVEKFDKLFTGDFLYRVGNQNVVKLDSLFQTKADVTIGDNVSVTIEAVNDTNASGTYTPNATWTNGTIQFSGTGVVKVTITDNDYCIPTELYLEVVDAYNATQNSELMNRNSVLLNDIVIKTNGAYYLDNGSTLYGNGFTFDCTGAAYTGSGSVSENYVVALTNAHLDNVQIVGKVYTEYGAQASNNYNRALVVSKGNSTITNCYLSNTASPVRLVEGTLEIKGTTMKGGNFANVDIRNGHLVLEDCTTINQSLGNDKAEDGTEVIGLGVVVYYENVDATLTSIAVKELRQYNYISSDDKFTNEYASQFTKEMFAEKYRDIQYLDEEKDVMWVNTSIICMTENIDVTGTAFEAKEVSFLNKRGVVYTSKPTESDIKEAPATYVSFGQGLIAPAYNFDFTSKNYIAKTDGSNDFCYFDNNIEKLQISMDEGDTFEWDPYILTVKKNGKALEYSVFMDNKTYGEDEKIAFNTAGDYIVTYSYVDENNYDIDEEGNVIAAKAAYTKELRISVAVEKPSIQHATFTFADTGTATEKITVNDKTYISAKGVSATDKEWGYITVNGTKIFYPITEAQMEKNGLGTEVQVYYYVFKDAVTITDYRDGGTGGEQKYDSSTETMPSNLTVVNGMEAKYTDINSACVDISKLTKDGPSGEVWDFSASTTVSGTKKYEGYLAHSSPSGLSVKEGTRDYDAITVAQFSYTDEADATYYYFIGYFMPNQYSSGGSGCVTLDTLFTMADGTQKRADELAVGDVVRVFNHITGQYEAAPIIFNTHFDEEEREYEVLHLQFANGKEVKIVAAHGFYDMTLMQYVYITNENYQDYIGHEFYSLNYDGTNGEAVKLEKAFIETEMTRIFCPVSYFHMNSFANGFLNTPNIPGGITGLVNYFEYDADMKYNEEAMQRDIEKYGVYTYDDFKEYISEAAFNSSPSVHLKVAVGKGMITFEQILDVIDYLLSGSLID